MGRSSLQQHGVLAHRAGEAICRRLAGLTSCSASRQENAAGPEARWSLKVCQAAGEPARGEGGERWMVGDRKGVNHGCDLVLDLSSARRESGECEAATGCKYLDI